ncbi:MAG: cytochrome c oxidase accessory protein CcoG, partial [Epsilonproteobacteria bacterium]|nr:cytochrome c oxidase accessory protein CcoG [Campylobacterota bacterium]
ECVDACTKVMGALGKPSLVRWSSEKETIAQDGKTQYLRFKTIMYAAALVIVLIALFAMGSKKENMLLNVNKTTRLYKINDNGVVENDYIFLFANTDSKAHTYYFEVVGNKDLKIIRPTEPFKIGAGKKKKSVVVIETNKVLVNDATKDTPLPIKIKAYAVDDKKNIVVERDTVFTYPRIDLLKK